MVQDQQQIKIFYGGMMEYISYTVNDKYEDIVNKAVERFDIPSECKEFIQIGNESTYIFEKDTFEYFILLFPNPQLVFFMRVNRAGNLRYLRSKTSDKPLAGLINKRRDRNENGAGLLTRQNCFIGYLPGDESLVDAEPNAKRPRTDFGRSKVAAVRRIISKKSIRI